MKRFLMNLIIGVLLMAIGITTLLMEIKNFEIVDGRELYKDEIKTYTLNVKDQGVNIRFLYPYHSTYKWKYDDSLQDEVKIEVLKGAEYTFDKEKNSFEIRDIYPNNNYQTDGFRYLGKVLDGLKEKKLYTVGVSASLVITSSRESLKKITIENNKAGMN